MTTGRELWPMMLPPSRQGVTSLCGVAAEGVRVRFMDGSERLDGSSGLWNVNLGYGNRAIADAIFAAACEASYLSSWNYENVYARAAATGVAGLFPSDFEKVFFCTSGGSANDAALKMARQHAILNDTPERRFAIGLRDSYHGLTFGALSLTDAQVGHRAYGADRRLTAHVRANDVDELALVMEQIGPRTAAVFVEPVLGTGAVELSRPYVAALCDLRRRYGFLLVADEISTGFGRVGSHLFASESWPEQPDLILLGKAITNGTLPCSAIVVHGNVWRGFESRDAVFAHAETQAGSSVVAAAVTATLGEMSRLDVLSLARRLTSKIDDKLEQLSSEFPNVSHTGVGCMRSIRILDSSLEPLSGARVTDVVSLIRKHGALVHPGPSSLSLMPALVYSDADLQGLFTAISAALSECYE